MHIDLHAHSTASDGTDSPAEVVAAAARAGLDVLALTDHDTLAGVEAARAAAQAYALTVVPGVEISCHLDGVSLHLLGYWPDPDHPELAAELALNRDDRLPRAQEIVRRLSAAGYPVTWADVVDHIPDGATVGRPHIADTLVALRVVDNRDGAFASLLGNDSPFYVGHHALEPEHAVRLVREAGGASVFAHPGAGRRGAPFDDEVIRRLARAGLDGLEVDHPDHDEAARAHYRRIAAELGLVVTGSSDYHGTGKLQDVGAETTDPAAFEALQARAARGGGG